MHPLRTRGDRIPAWRRLRLRRVRLFFRRILPPRHITVIAQWSDGTHEDVTPLCRFQSNDENVVRVSEDGEVRSVGHGDSTIVAFYDRGIATLPVFVPRPNANGSPDVPMPTPLDRIVFGKLKRLGIEPSGLCNDRRFLRRVSLDLTGTLPSPDEIESFAADTSTEKRTRKIDELLRRPTHTAYWATVLCRFTGNFEYLAPDALVKHAQSRQWYYWLRRRVENNTPYHKIVEGIVVATSRSSDQSYVDYCRDMAASLSDDGQIEFGGRSTMPHFWGRKNYMTPESKLNGFCDAFLGVQIRCAECHKHPFDRWTKADFENFLGFFQPIRYRVPTQDKVEFDRLSRPFQGRGGRGLNRAMVRAMQSGQDVPWRARARHSECEGRGRYQD